MVVARDHAATALAIMRGWAWPRCDPDGAPFPPGMTLSSIVSRLAFDGVRRPENALLQLLSQGDLVAQGSYRWRKFQDLKHYQQEGGTRISAKHWQHLADAITSAKVGDGDSYIEVTYQLTELALEDCLAFIWDYDRDGFSYANLTDDLETWDEDYLEEWFSAWDIEARPKFLDELDALEFSVGSAAADANEPKQGRGRSVRWCRFSGQGAKLIPT
jgi:hypothetical protein